MEKCEKMMSASTNVTMPEPPMAIQGLLDDYQDFLVSVFAREYQENYTNPINSNQKYMPRLSREEKQYIENLTTVLRTSPEWKEYVNQCTRWAVNM